MAQPNPNDTKLEQQRSDAAETSLKNQTESNYVEDSADAADRIADNAAASQKDE
jgi:hypothetical protein